MVDPGLALLVFFGVIGISLMAWKWDLFNVLFRDRKLYHQRLKEDILKATYKVEKNNRNVDLEGISQALGISVKTTLRLVEDLTRDKYMVSSGSDLVLTEEGKSYAIQIIRGHRLWETYLSEKTGIKKSEWHDLAEKKEHKLTEADIYELDNILGNPTFDPHGDPIPTASGEMVQPDWKSLSSLEVDTKAKIVHIEDEPKTIYDQIIDANLLKGSHLIVTYSDEREVRFECEGEQYVLSPIVASNVNVRELNEQEVLEEDIMRLSSLQKGEIGKVVGISSECRGANRRRLLDLGFVNGTPIRMEYDGPLKNPKAYLIKNTLIALRKDQSDFILIEKSNGTTTK